MKASFKPRARLLKLLGDQLIGTSQLAIFELIKNSYDADAERVEVVISNPQNPSSAKIEVTDLGGEGMSLHTIKNVWLEPGALDHRQVQKEQGKRSKKHGRLPLGEKGVGRFAVHKLGKVIELTTRSKGAKEIYLKIDWAILDEFKYIEDAKIEIVERDEPKVFVAKETGTRIVVSQLNNTLNQKDVRNLYRNALSIQSPFEFAKFKLDPKIPNFEVSLRVEGHPSGPETSKICKTWSSNRYSNSRSFSRMGNGHGITHLIRTSP